MTNDATRATAGALPEINRRRMLAGAVAIPACGLAAIVPAAAMTADPLLDAINAFRAGDAAYAAQDGEDEEAIEATYGPPFRALSEWEQPATSLVAVREAVRLAVERGGICCPASEAALTAALAYLDQEGGAS